MLSPTAPPPFRGLRLRTFTTASRSRPGRRHELVVDEQGRVISCTCEAWRFRARCRHAVRLEVFLAEFRQENGG